jgi:uncharacterized protein (DUF2147 family)
MKSTFITLKRSLFTILTGLALLFGNTSMGLPAEDPNTIIGVWKTGEGNAVVRIYKNGDKYQGKIVWLKEPNDPETMKPKLDKNNPTESFKNRPVLGLINLWGFSQTSKNLWEDGNIYDPKSGNTYSCTIKMISLNSLEVRGYIGVSIIGRTDIWTRQVAKN